MKVKYLYLSLLIASLTGCATSTIKSVEEAQQRYGEMSLQEFIKERFYDERPVSSAINSVVSFMSRFNSNPQPQKEEQLIYPDGTVIYRAHFNSSNDDQLSRPLYDLGAFCNAKGGTFKVIKPFNQNFAKDQFNANLMSNMASYDKTAVTMQNKYNYSAETITLGRQQALSNLLQSYERNGVFEGMRILDKQHGFGIFSCTKKENVAVIPTKYISPTQNCRNSPPNDSLCRVHSLHIAIKAINIDQQGINND